MTTFNEEIAKEKNTFLQTARVQMGQWRDELNKLEEEISRFSSEAQESYRKSVAGLKSQWEQVELLFNKMEQAGSEQWENARVRWQKTAESYRQALMATADQLKKEEVPLG